jgi:hypothetical protein
MTDVIISQPNDSKVFQSQDISRIINSEGYQYARPDNTDLNIFSNPTKDNVIRVFETGVQPSSSVLYAVKITNVGDISYVGRALPGSVQSQAVWQALKLDETTNLSVSWADSDIGFNNTSSDLTSLSYGSATDSAYTVKITYSGLITYVAKAPYGSAESSAVWQVLKIDETSDTVLTWADSNTNYDNIATDLTVLTYG